MPKVFDNAVVLARTARLQGRRAVPVSVDVYHRIKEEVPESKKYQNKSLFVINFEHILVNGIALFPFPGGEGSFKKVLKEYIGE